MTTAQNDKPFGAQPEGMNWTLKEWDDWVRDWLATRMTTFANDPDVMISLYNGEQKTVHEYHGRELLELLQNADDAAVGFGPNKALIELRRDGMCVANTGISFSTAGIRSLMIPDRSPKQLDRNRYVGNRGLGFRSVLNWTNSPGILSAQLRLAYAPEYAARQLQAVCAKSSTARRLVEEQANIGVRCPIPTLSCPMICNGQMSADSVQARAAALRDEGYDTVIVLPFTRAGAYGQVADQVSNLLKTRELMLFLQNLEQLEIRTETETHAWRVTRERDRVRVRVDENTGAPMEWRIFTRRGNVPEEFLDELNRQTPSFEIKIAVPMQAGSGGVLFNYFPSQIAFPYPVVAHATMDLTANRDHLERSTTNKFLVAQLAEVLAEAADGVSCATDIWRPLRQITKDHRDVDLMLKEYGFEASLASAAKLKKLIPRRDGSIGIAADAKQLPVETGDWLPKEEFGDLACWPDDYYLRQTLTRLQVPLLSSDDFRKRLNRISPCLSLTERKNLIGGLVQHASVQIPTNPVPSLLIQADGNLIEPEAKAYIPSTEQQNFALPAWLTLRFISNELVDALVAKLNVTRKELAIKLQSLNVHDYDFRELASAINARINERCRQSGVDEQAARLQGLHALKGLFESVPPGTVPNRRDDLRVLVPTRTGEWKHAGELYLGNSYPNGGLMEALLGAQHPEKFVAPSSVFGTAEEAGKWQALLQWLGAEIVPKESKAEWIGNSYFDYVAFVKRTLKRPLIFGEFTVEESKEIRDASVSAVSSVEYLEEILANADPHAVLAWLALDPRMDRWRVEGDQGAKLQARFVVQTYRELSNRNLPSYILWRLRESAWLPTANGQRGKPVECVQVRIPNEEIRKMFPRPAVNANDPLLHQLGIDADSFRLALTRAGVCMSLDDLPWERCYEVLLHLPESNPEGDAATPFYRMLAEKEDIDLNGLHYRKEFQRTGKLWTRLGKERAYRLVSEKIFFVTDATVPAAVVNAFPIIELPKRRGTEKLRRIFCIKSLRAADISIEMSNNYIPLARTEVLNDAVEKLKPFVLAVRLAANPDATGIQQLKKMQIVACGSVDATARLGDSEIPIRLETVGESLISGEKAHVIANNVEPEHPLDDPVMADSIANILASILQVDQTNEFARLAMTKHDARHQVLSLILQHDAGDALRRAREALEMAEEDEIQPEGRTVPPTVPLSSLLTLSTEPPPVGPDITPTQFQQLGLPAEVFSQPLDHVPQPVPETISFRVRSERTDRENVQRVRRVTDGDRCERITILHETERGRFPVSVGTIQGDQAFGCDVISFPTEADRVEFQTLLQQGIIGNLEKAIRFIEVKGRSTATGSVSLQGNQLNEARSRKERYFIYRVFEAVDGEEWRIAALKNPLLYEWPVSYKVDPEQRAEAEFWSVLAVRDADHDRSTYNS